MAIVINYDENRTGRPYSKEGLINAIYRRQQVYSKKRGHPRPTYTKEELHKWFSKQSNFDELHKAWIESGCKIYLIPSVDRLDNSRGYSFDNIRLVTFAENHLAGLEEKVKPVMQFDLTGRLLGTFDSLRDASNATKVSYKSISSVVTHKNLTTANFIWIFKDEYTKELLDETVLKVRNRLNGGSTGRAIVQFDLYGGYIETYETITEAANTVNALVTTLARAAKEKCTASGYIWLYDDMYNDNNITAKVNYVHDEMRNIVVIEDGKMNIYDSILSYLRLMDKQGKHIGRSSFSAKVKNLSDYTCYYLREKDLYNDKDDGTDIDDRIILQISYTGTLYNKFSSIEDASVKLGLPEVSVERLLNKQFYGYSDYVLIYSTGNDNVDIKNAVSFVRRSLAKVRSLTPVLQISLDGHVIERFNSYADAAIKMGVGIKAISAASDNASSRKSTVNGFAWTNNINASSERIKEIAEIGRVAGGKQGKPKPVSNYTYDGVKVNSFDGAIEAGKEYDIKPSTIKNAARGTVKKAGGFVWIFNEDYSDEILQTKISKIKK